MKQLRGLISISNQPKSSFLIFSLSFGEDYTEPIGVLALPWTRAPPIPPPPLTWGAMGDTELLLAGTATALPGFGLAEELLARGACSLGSLQD